MNVVREVMEFIKSYGKVINSHDGPGVKQKQREREKKKKGPLPISWCF
jgi:hypothetical protein